MEIALSIIKYLVIDLIASVFYFPLWWYTDGLKKIVFAFSKNIKNLFRGLALNILFKNIFRPMFGDYTWEGKIISFIIQLFWRLILFFCGFIWYLLILLSWIILPLIAVFQIIAFFTGHIFIPSVDEYWKIFKY